MKILELIVKKEWFEMILSGEKLEEYREIKEFWISRFIIDRINKKSVAIQMVDGTNTKDHKKSFFVEDIIKTINRMLNSTSEFKHYDAARFRYGYTKRTMLFKLDSISIGVDKPEWGAPKEKVFILKLGEKIE